MIPRRVGKQDLVPTADELALADRICPGWYPQNWSWDQVARSLLLLTLPQEHQEQVRYRLEQLFTTAGIGELVALHQTLPLLPYPERYRFWADEAVRSHMTAVFHAIALHNPYPARHFDAAAWNQLILKAIFVGAPLHPIYGLDERANSTLARMLIDYVHERWAAKRQFTPELWRLVAPFITTAILPDLETALSTGDRIQQEAVALACTRSQLPAAVALLDAYPQLKQRLDAGAINWSSIYQHRAGYPLAAQAV
jgi:hypothetical protein